MLESQKNSYSPDSRQEVLAKMQAFIIFLLFVKGCLSFDLPRDGCESDFKIDKDHYKIANTYHVGEADPTDVHYDVYGNLFYVKSRGDNEGYYYDIYVIKFKTNVTQKVIGLPEGVSYSVAVDDNNTKVYFGTEHGIFSYNYETHDATQITPNSLKINMIFVDKDSNKYVTENNNGIEELYLLDGDKKIRFSTLEALNELAIDNENNFYFIKHESLYVLRSNVSAPVLLGNVTYNGVGQIAVHQDNVFIASDHLAYFHDDEAGKMNLITNIPDKVTAIAFNREGELVLGTRGKLVHYKKHDCYFT